MKNNVSGPEYKEGLASQEVEENLDIEEKKEEKTPQEEKNSQEEKVEIANKKNEVEKSEVATVENAIESTKKQRKEIKEEKILNDINLQDIEKKIEEKRKSGDFSEITKMRNELRESQKE